MQAVMELYQKRSGSAGTAGISWWAPPPPRFAPSAPIPRLTLRFTRRIIKYICVCPEAWHTAPCLRFSFIGSNLQSPSKRLTCRLFALVKNVGEISGTTDGLSVSAKLGINLVLPRKTPRSGTERRDSSPFDKISKFLRFYAKKRQISTGKMRYSNVRTD